MYNDLDLVYETMCNIGERWITNDEDYLIQLIKLPSVHYKYQKLAANLILERLEFPLGKFITRN